MFIHCRPPEEDNVSLLFNYTSCNIFIELILLSNILTGTSNTPYQTTYSSRTGAQSKASNVNNLLISDHILRIKKLENELIEANMKTRVSLFKIKP